MVYGYPFLTLSIVYHTVSVGTLLLLLILLLSLSLRRGVRGESQTPMTRMLRWLS